jgi:hypothetical protein
MPLSMEELRAIMGGGSTRPVADRQTATPDMSVPPPAQKVLPIAEAAAQWGSLRPFFCTT